MYEYPFISVYFNPDMIASLQSLWLCLTSNALPSPKQNLEHGGGSVSICGLYQ